MSFPIKKWWFSIVFVCLPEGRVFSEMKHHPHPMWPAVDPVNDSCLRRPLATDFSTQHLPHGGDGHKVGLPSNPRSSVGCANCILPGTSWPTEPLSSGWYSNSGWCLITISAKSYFSPESWNSPDSLFFLGESDPRGFCGNQAASAESPLR